LGSQGKRSHHVVASFALDDQTSCPLVALSPARVALATGVLNQVHVAKVEVANLTMAGLSAEVTREAIEECRPDV